MKKILQIGMGDFLGGIETFIINYYRKLDKSEYQFDFINIKENDLFFNDEIIAGGSTIYNIPNYYKHPIKYIKELKNIIKEHRYEVVHCNMNSAVFIYPLIAAKMGGAKIIIAHSHNSSNDKGILKSLLHDIMKHFIPIFANRYVACSDKAGKWFFSKKVRKGANYYIINNSIDISKFTYNEESRKKIREDLNIDLNTLVIGHVGRFRTQKNHKFIVKLANELKDKKINYKMLLIGKGPLLEEIEESVKELNLEKEVLFLGQKLNVNEIMNAMDIFILPSLYEGLPIVSVEAQGNGLKCFLSDNITREVEDSNNVEFLPIDNTEIWTKKIADFQLKKHNRNVTLKKFNIDKSIEKLYDLYNNI